MATAAARLPVARGSAAPAPRQRPIALQAGHFMIVSRWGQIAPKSAHDHETWSPPGTRAARRMSSMRCYVPIEIALRDRVPQERPVTHPEICDRALKILHDHGPAGYTLLGVGASVTEVPHEAI